MSSDDTVVALRVGPATSEARSAEDVARVRRLAAAFSVVVAHLDALGQELDALRLASRQRRARLLQGRMSRSDPPLRHVADALVAPANDDHFSIVSMPGVDAETRRRDDTRLCLQRLGEELADSVPAASTVAKAVPRRR